jgi:hypothetical protein
MRVLLTFCLGWPQTTVLLISPSCETGITNVTHDTQAQASLDIRLLYQSGFHKIISVTPQNYRPYIALGLSEAFLVI